MPHAPTQSEILDAFRGELQTNYGPLSVSLAALAHRLGGPIDDADAALEFGRLVLDFAEDGIGETTRAEFQAFAAALEQLMPPGSRKCGKLVSRARGLTRFAREER